jgi:fucose permease
MSLLLPMMVAALLASGMGVAVLGSVKVPLAQRLQIDEARVGGLVSIFAFVMIPVILTAGFLTDLVGPKVVLLSGCGLMVASLLLLAQARNYAWALGSVLLLGGGWSLLINVGNVLTIPAFGEPPAFATNLANVFFGLGAFLTPLAVAYLVRLASLPVAIRVLALLPATTALLALAVNFAAVATSAPTEEAGAAGVADLLANPVLWLCGFALFFYGPLEASTAAWATTYLGEQGVPEQKASGLLSGFWLAFMLSRLLTAFTLPAGREPVLILIGALVAVAVLSAVVLSRSRQLAVGLVLAAGLAFGPIFPTIMAILLGRTPENLHGRAVGLFFAIGGVGWTFIPILIGAYARRAGVQRGFAIAVAAAVVLSIVAVLLNTPLAG